MSKFVNKVALIAAFLAIPLGLQAQEAKSVMVQYNVDRPDLQAYIDSTSSKDILDQSTAFRDVAKSGRFGRLPARYTRALVNGTKEITGLLNGHQSISELDARDRSDLDKTRWDIVNVMARFDPDRVICSEVMMTGSRIPQMSCMKVRDAIAQQQQAQRATKELLNNAMFCVQGGAVPCGGG